MTAPKLTKAQRAKLLPSEHDEQCAVVTWCRYASPAAIRPLTSLIYAVPNQGRMGGRRGAMWGERLSREGLRRGVPDLCLPVACQMHMTRPIQNGTVTCYQWSHALYIEMKRRGEAFEQPTRDQLAWHATLREQGYTVHVAAGCEHAISIIEAYLGGGDPEEGMILNSLDDYEEKP